MKATENTDELSNLSRDYLHACQSGNLTKVEHLTLRHDLQDWTIFRHSVSGDTPLHVAAREGHLNVVRYLCESFEKSHFRVDVANKDMKRPLHEAAQFARSNVLKYLIEKGATVDSLKRADWTPLMLACTKTGVEACQCINLLLEAKADPFIRNKDGWTALFLACRSGDVKALSLLLSVAPECIHGRSNNGRSALHIAAFHGHEPVIDLLVAKDASLLNARDSSGATPLHEAIKSGNLNATKRMIELGADFRVTDKVGQTILHVAATVGSAETIDYILANDLIDVHAETSFGVTPLMAARRSEQTDAVNVLIKYKAER